MRRARRLAVPGVGVALALSSLAGAPATAGQLLAAPVGARPSTSAAAPAGPIPRGSTAGQPAAMTRLPPDPDPAMPAAPAQPPGRTTIISKSAPFPFGEGPTYLGGNDVSQAPAISATGRYIAFQSRASNLVAGTAPAPTSIYLVDRAAKTTIALPLPKSMKGGGLALAPSISADGSVVAFQYQSPTEDTSIVVWDRATGQTVRVSLPANPNESDQSGEPSVSADGRYVAFTSFDASLVPNDTNSAADVFRYDRRTGVTDIVSDGIDGTGSGYAPSISGDGSIVAFVSDRGANIITGDAGAGSQVFVRDMNSRTTQEVSVGAGGAAPDGRSLQPSISDNGQFIAFASYATNLLSGVSVQTGQTYRRDLAAGQTVLVSAKTDGTPDDGIAGMPGISRDGRMVAFLLLGKGVQAFASSQRLNDIVLLRDVTAGATALVSVNLSGQPSASYSLGPRVGASGRYVTFASEGADLVAGDDNNLMDVFLRDMPPVPSLKPATLNFGSLAVGVAPTYLATTMTNSGWGPTTPKPATITGANAGDFTVLTDGCAGQTLYRGDACTVTIAFAPKKPGTRSATGQIALNAPGSPLSVNLRGAGSQSKIVLDPPVGPQGIVVVVTGRGFPAKSQIQLNWSTGITPSLPIVTADKNGTWSIQVLVFHHDVTGQRNLVATWVGGPEFPTVSVPMLVTVRSMTPPDVLRGGLGPITLLFRG